MISSLPLQTLSFAYQGRPWEENLATLLGLLEQAKPDSLSLAPELCLTGYSYGHMEEAAAFSQQALEKLHKATHNKALGLTCIVQTPQGFANRFYLLENGRILHHQDKAKLFPLGDEPAHFVAGETSAIVPFSWRGIRLGVLVCFELRFPALWEQLRGAELLLVPALWGKERKGHYETLCDALAIANQCYVLAANASDEANGSGITDPFGASIRNDTEALLTCTATAKTLTTMRRYINTGLLCTSTKN